MTAPSPAPPSSTKAWKPRFSLLSLMLTMLVFVFIGAVGGRMRAAVDGGTSPRVFFIFFTLIAPMLLLVLLAIGRNLVIFLRLRRSEGRRHETV